MELTNLMNTSTQILIPLFCIVSISPGNLSLQTSVKQKRIPKNKQEFEHSQCY